MFLKLSKKLFFVLQFCADLSKPSKSIKEIYIYASERSRYLLSENGIVYNTMTCFRNTRVWRWRIFFKFQLSQDLFWYANVSWTVGQTHINHVIFWKSVMRTFRCIYVNCIDRWRFFAEVRTKLLKKMHFFWQYKNHNLGWKRWN